MIPAPGKFELEDYYGFKNSLGYAGNPYFKTNKQKEHNHIDSLLLNLIIRLGGNLITTTIPWH